MGNTSSSSASSQDDSNSEKSKTSSNKVPKHLQPLKRKTTSKRLPKILRRRAVDDINQTYSNDTRTLQVKLTTKVDKPVKNLVYIEQASSSPQLFRWTKGRRYQSNDVSSVEDFYPLPNDQTELDRHRVQLYIIRWAFESRHIVPPKIKQKLFEGIKVLDVSCGPGLWLGHPILDMAQDFARSEFDSINLCNLLPSSFQIHTSTDEKEDTTAKTDAINNKLIPPQERFFSFQPSMSPSSLTNKKKLDNFKLTTHNIVKDGKIPFEDHTFDFVQKSLTALVVPLAFWLPILNDMKRVTKPGGYIQLIEVDFYIQPLGIEGGLWRDQILDGLRQKRGLEPRIALQLSNLLREIGLVDIETRFVTIPLGPWGLDIGNLWEQNLDAFLESGQPFLTDLLQISDTEYEKQRKILKNDFVGGHVKPFNNAYIAWGRVPS